MQPSVPTRSRDTKMVCNISPTLLLLALLTLDFFSDALEPFCGTYAFPGDTSLFDCQVTSMPIQDVEFLNDFYITAIGSTLAPDATTNPFGFTASAYLNPFTASATNSVASQSSSGSTLSTTSNSSHSGLSQGAIDGIAAGAAIIGVLLLGLSAFCCIRARRHRKRVAAASQPPTHLPPPMQQQAQPPPPPKAFDGYQSVPQQEQQYTQYPGPHQHAQSYFPPPASASAVSPQSTDATDATDPRFSTANASLFSSRPSEPDQRQSYYKPPFSPTVTEVDGTMGNPGVPTTDISHGVPTEVDGTMGNPGIPTGGHGIEYQMMPGGSPSAAEIEGRTSTGAQQQQQQAPLRKPIGGGAGGGQQQGVMGASLNGPYSEGPYELGHGGR